MFWRLVTEPDANYAKFLDNVAMHNIFALDEKIKIGHITVNKQAIQKECIEVSNQTTLPILENTLFGQLCFGSCPHRLQL
jgi:hypothetical protein